MVGDPYVVLGLDAAADDEAIRRRYLELVREFPPEQHPERFAAIRAAYEALKDIDTRLRRRFFERSQSDTLDAIIEDAACRKQRGRMTLDSLIQLTQARP